MKSDYGNESVSGVSESNLSSGEKLPEGDRVEENPPAHSSNLSPLAKMRNAELGVKDE